MLCGGAPKLFFSEAMTALSNLAAPLISKVAAPGYSSLLKARHELFVKLGIAPRDIGYLNSTMIFASTTNTIPTACWTLYYILRSPSAHKAVLAELAGKTGGGGGDREDLPVLSACITETLRVTVSSLVVRRVCDEGYTFKSGLKMRGGDRVAIFPPLQHHDEGIFPNSSEWNHGRFLEDPSLVSKVIPFGGGISMCPGRHFALREVKAFVTTALSTLTITLADPSAPLPPCDPSRVGIGINQVKPGSDVMINVEARKKE